MDKISIYSNFVKIVFVTLLEYLVYVKITNYKGNNIYKNLFMLVCSILISILYIFLTQYFYSLSVIITLYLIYVIIINNITSQDKYNIIAYIISFAIAYMVYLIAIIISGISLAIFCPNVDYKNPISLLLIPSIGILLFFCIFKIKRFKNGFNFLQCANVSKNIVMYTIFFSGITIILFGFFQKTNTDILNTTLFTGIVLVTISLVVWVKIQITNQYRKNMKDRTIEIQKKEIDEKSKIIEDIKEENFRLAKVIHKYNNRLGALELGIKNAIEQNTKTEFAEELGFILKETEDISKKFAEETAIESKKLPSTNINEIDNMFKYMQKEANKESINFDLNINESINPLLEETISKEKFVTLIGDHLRDAIIAVNKSEDSYKSILVVLGMIENCYEFSVYDTGIEFDIEVLLKLGLEQVTTHKETGGRGIGFMTTFETLRECKASLIIEEYDRKTTNYTKSVTIRFDGKNEYKICSYRSDEIRKKNKASRIIIENL